MKTLLIACAVLIIFAACTKNDIKPESSAVTSNSEDFSVKTRSAFLIAHPWKYKGFYFHYIDQQHKGDPQYERGTPNNLVDLDATRFIFRKNGTFVEHDGGYTYPGTWKFTDNTASLLVLDFTYWKDNDSILVLSDKHWNYTQPMGYHSKSYSELIPAQ